MARWLERILPWLLLTPICGLVVAACALEGCSRPRAFDIVVDPDFTTQESAEIFAAAEEWSYVVPMTFRVRIGPCSGFHDEMICVHRSTPEDVASMYGGPLQPGEQIEGITATRTAGDLDFDTGDEAQIWLAPMVTDDEFERVAAHELGHAMGLKHPNQAADFYGDHPWKSVMSDLCPCYAPQAGDVRQWWALH